MANVSDTNLWRAIPLSDSHHVHASQPHAAPLPSHGPTPLFQEEHRAEEECEIVELSTALRNLFDSQRDQVVWNLSPSRSRRRPTGEQYVRLDPRHGYGPAIARSKSAAKLDEAGRPSTSSWLIIVDDAHDLLRADSQDHLRSALEQVSQILLVACEVEDAVDGAAADNAAATSLLAIEMSDRLQFEYVGPISAQDSSQLLEALGKIKQHGRPALLHLKTHAAHSAFEPHAAAFHAAPDAGEEVAVPSGLVRHLASHQLAQLALDDARIVAVSTDLDTSVLDPWNTIPHRMFPVEAGVAHALEWCASLAAGGSRPFAFLAWEELQNSFGEVRQSICLNRAPVTLIVEPRAALVDETGACSAGLAGIRQLPHTSLLSPKDGTELRQMLAWCALQGDPAIVWLPQTVDPRIEWKEECPIDRGRAEILGDGRDVAIVAFGPMAAAAISAGEGLAQYGIAATIVNARFAQPLDVDTILQAARDALCVVVVDDTQAGGGFGSWVLEHLVHSGITQPVSIVAPGRHASDQPPEDLQRRCALRIVECCRWLSAPILPQIPIDPLLPSVTGGEGKVAPERWLGFYGRHADSMAREREQVYARQLSSDMMRWISAYEEIGSRDLYLWKWCLHGVDLTTLPCVVPEFRAHVCDTKVLSIVLCVLLDDVADQHGDSHLLDALLEMTCWGVSRSLRGLSAAERRHAELTRALWSEYWTRVAGYPCFDTYDPVLRYDLLQFFNTMRYSHLVNGRPYLLNMVEHDLYTSHNMMMVSFAMLDLMCSPEFPPQEVGILREAMWHAQCMGRIGNLLSTWRRELADRDFTSGVFARAMMEGDLTLDELEHGDLAKLEATVRSRGYESHFFQKWLEHRERCHARASRIRSFDLRSVLDGHDRFFAMHLGSQGLI
jgi:deoxyxylulose-5-phosphate synthase